MAQRDLSTVLRKRLLSSCSLFVLLQAYDKQHLTNIGRALRGTARHWRTPEQAEAKDRVVATQEQPARWKSPELTARAPASQQRDE